MKQFRKMSISFFVIIAVLATSIAVYGNSYTGYTSGGTRGKTKVTCTIGNGSNSYYSQAFFKLTTENENKVDSMTIKNINVVTSNGGGTMGAKKTGTMTDNIIYNCNYSPSLSIVSASATFSINCSAFGTFTRNLSL